jgi:hypothetical protein
LEEKRRKAKRKERILRKGRNKKEKHKREERRCRENGKEQRK